MNSKVANKPSPDPLPREREHARSPVHGVGLGDQQPFAGERAGVLQVRVVHMAATDDYSAEIAGWTSHVVWGGRVTPGPRRTLRAR